jgi:hypothetical protein
MPDWLLALLIGSSGGGLVGYLFHGWIDDRFARAKEARALRQSDVRALRDGLHVFLGQPKAHFTWLESVPDVRSAGGTPTPPEKAEIIAAWVYENAMKHPKDRRGAMYLITNVAYQLARGDRHFLDKNPKGYEALEEAWNALGEYAQFLTRTLHNPDSPGGAA